MSKDNKTDELLDKLDVEIMEWIYELARINFDVEVWVQDSSELRGMISQFRKQLIENIEKDLPEEDMLVHSKLCQNKKCERYYTDYGDAHNTYRKEVFEILTKHKEN